MAKRKKDQETILSESDNKKSAQNNSENAAVMDSMDHETLTEVKSVADDAELQESNLKTDNTDEERSSPTLEEEVEMLKKENESLRAELELARDNYLRRIAEFENIKRRMMREKEQFVEKAKMDALNQFLPVNDDLQRTIQATGHLEIPKAFMEGVTLVADKFSEVLREAGVEVINETGVPFDVNLHDAMLRAPSPDNNTPSNTILQILENGYKVGNTVIRHAKVIVSE